MGRNEYLKQQYDMKQKILDVGEEIGMQKMWDYVQIALRDRDVMGKDTLGKKRLEKIFKKLSELANHYHLAFTDHKEADVTQEHLDRELREIWGDQLQPFYERYPYLKKMDYNKGKKEWK